MTAVIYARYSSDNQREESIEGQLRECTAFADKNGITVLRHYIDRAVSAKTDNRPEFQNMINDSGKKLFDMIIVWKLDRFARNRYDSARYKAQLKKNGVKVVSATEVISDGAEGIILESMLEGFAEYYSVDLSEKVVRGMTDNALKCMFNGGTLPMGYQIDADQHFQIDPVTAPYILDAFKRYDEGATMTEIRDWLNEQGMKNTLGKSLTYNSVNHLLANRRYMGEFRYRDIVTPDGIPAIVPKDLFDRVQERLTKNKKAPARTKAEDEYLLTTKIFCGYCGAYLCGESGTARNGTIHRYYKCVSLKKRRTECHKKPVKKAWIEDLVIRETMGVIMDDARKLDFADSSITENTRAAYPVEYIPNCVIPGMGNHPKTVIFLTADAFGVLPPISKLTKDMAKYHFVSGYTSKLAGTERGIKEPQATFSTCFGAPFLPMHPSVYAEMLGKKIDEHNANVFLINTGWSGGPYGVGSRMKIKYTRAMVTAALEGKLNDVEYKLHPIFNVLVPQTCPNVPAEVLNPRDMWADKDAYDEQAKKLAAMFIKNFSKYNNMPENIINAGPKQMLD